jgi:hypothetical protein
MKQITISICCLSLFTLSALAQDPAADNTSKNQRDRSGETRTSGDQSNSPRTYKSLRLFVAPSSRIIHSLRPPRT